MLKKAIFFINSIILGSLILIFEHIGKFQFFGFLYPWISYILIIFVIYFSLTIPYFFKKPKGLYALIIGTLFILVHFTFSTKEHFITSLVFLSFIVITTIVVKNSDQIKLKFVLRVITYCCLINLIYAIYEIVIGQAQLGARFRISGLDQTPVLFGYNMLLGFWLVLINSIIYKKSNNVITILDKFLALAFICGIFLSKSAGALFGLIMGITFIFLIQRKFKINNLVLLLILFISTLTAYFLYPSFFEENLVFGRIEGKLISILNSEEARFIMWANMLEVYFEKLDLIKLLFGGGQGYGTDLISRGVHNEHLKILFDYGILGLLVYYFKVLSCIRLVKEFNIYIIGFVVSTFASGIFYVNSGSITNSFSYIIVIIIFSNYNLLKKYES